MIISSRTFIFLTFVTGAAGATPPGTIHVANNGLDSATCGSFHAPCRTITRGVERAQTGDTVLVRAGRYGDVNGDGVLSGPEDELFSGSGGALRVAKAVKVLSADGAAVTVIDGGKVAFSAVQIAADGATFGAVDEGFTVVGGQFYGIYVEGQTNVRIIGNVVADSPAHGMLVSSTGVVEVSDNVVHDNFGAGIIALSANESQRVLVRRNKVYSNGEGISSASFGRHEISFNEVSNNRGNGISVDYAPALVHRNVVTGNTFGIVPNSWSPDRLPSAGPTFSRNTLIANQQFGIIVSQGPVPTTLRENNFYGNGTGNSSRPNCGLANFTGGIINAAGSYWGAATGPGTDPADTTCSNELPELPTKVITTPFAKFAN